MQELREGLVENGQRWRTGPGDRLGACRRRHHGLRYRFGSVSIGAVPPAIDGPIRVDLARVQPRKRERYLQAVAPLSLASRTA